MPPPEQLMPALEEVLYSGQIGEGAKVTAFESAFAAQFGFAHAVALSSGTAALHAALALAGVGPGDEVISTPMTAEPTNLAILHAGARIRWADIDPDDGNIDPDAVSRAITSRTKAIIAVHYAGYPAQVDRLRAIADANGLALIEDCAHALGARVGDRHVGTVGDFAIFSFQAIKHMTTVDGGMLIVRDPAHLEAARRFRWFGLVRGTARNAQNITSLGYKYNMSNVTATIGLVQLATIKDDLARHIGNGRYLDRALAATPHLHAPRGARVSGGTHPSYWLYTLLCDDADALIVRLGHAGFEAAKLHQPNNRHALFADATTDLPGLERFYQRLVHLPCGWWVTEADCARMVEVIHG